MEFPCSVCAKECLQDTIQCNNCKNWVHSICVNLSAKDLQTWSAAHLNFLCKCCVFSGINYEAKAALSRMQKAMRTNRRNDLINQAKSEYKLLQTYDVKIPECQIKHTNFSADAEAVKIMQMYSPVMNSAYKPVQTVGDGNCLFRAVSLALSGSEEYHSLLRLNTALEMILNRNSYDTKKKHNNFLNDIRIVTSNYDKLIADVLTDGAYSEMGHMYGLSAALGECIQSYFPPQVNSELSCAFTRVVSGRDVIGKSQPKVMIMWSSMLAPVSVSAFKANHFVPLLSKEFESVDTASKKDINDSEPMSDTFSMFPVESFDSSIGHVYGCETLDESVTLSDITVRDFVSEADKVSTVYGKGATEETCVTHSDAVASDLLPGSLDAPDQTPSSTPGSETVDTDSPIGVSESASVSKPVVSEMQGVLESGFLDTSTVIAHLLKKVPGLSKIPPGSKENVYFLLDNKVNIEHRSNQKRSSFTDDRGIWNSSAGATPKSYFLLHENGDLSSMHLRQGQFCTKKMVKKQVQYYPLDPQPCKEQVVVLHRYYTTLKLDKGYKKRVTWLGEGGLESPLAIVEYVGKFPGHAPHGLSHDQTNEYIRRPDYVLSDIEKLSDEKHKPADIYLTLKETYDETTRPEIKTIYNKIGYMKKKTAECNGQILTTNVADQISHLDNLVTENDCFVRSVIRTGGKTPTVILYTDEQIHDIRTMCCSGQTVLGVDKTFNLCKMHVTVTCFKQLTVTTDITAAAPLFIGPMFIHDSSDYETYSYFFHHLRLKLGPNLAKLVIGSDEEQAMVKAIVTEFPDSSHVLCTRHLKENCRQHLVDDGVPITDRNVIMQKIFGTDGLVNATDDDSFDIACDDIEEHCANFSSKFVQYFRTRLRPNLKYKVNRPLREGVISSNWTNNNSESINHVLKQTVSWESKPLPEFVRLVKRVVTGQYQELRSALLSSGKYRLASTHKHFEVSKTKWTDMTQHQKDNLFKRYRQYVVKDDKIVTSTDGRTTVIGPKTGGKKPGQRKRKINVRTITINSKRTKSDD